jgi:galactokinase
MNLCLYGTVPKSAGLSSSSALVVCAALTTLYANKLILTKVLHSLITYKNNF